MFLPFIITVTAGLLVGVLLARVGEWACEYSTNERKRT